MVVRCLPPSPDVFFPSGGWNLVPVFFRDFSMAIEHWVERRLIGMV
jgi:hypothetical protein